MHAFLKHTNPKDNLLLGALPPDVLQTLSPNLELRSLKSGDILCDAGGKLTHVYFPTSAIISLLHVLEDGARAESAVVGNDGMLGVTLFMGGETTPSQLTVQNDGYAFRLRAQAFMNAFNCSSGMRRLLLRYSQTLIVQISQAAICNRHHTVQQQLCRKLLMMMDRLPTNEVNMTQELIASTLGVRREGVTEAAGRLKRNGLISYTRGRITVLDRHRLEESTCECYQIVKRECERMEPVPEPNRVMNPYSTDRRSKVRPPHPTPTSVAK